MAFLFWESLEQNIESEFENDDGIQPKIKKISTSSPHKNSVTFQDETSNVNDQKEVGRDYLIHGQSTESSANLKKNDNMEASSFWIFVYNIPCRLQRCLIAIFLVTSSLFCLGRFHMPF